MGERERTLVHTAVSVFLTGNEKLISSLDSTHAQQHKLNIVRYIGH